MIAKRSVLLCLCFLFSTTHANGSTDEKTPALSGVKMRKRTAKCQGAFDKGFASEERKGGLSAVHQDDKNERI